jgi:cyclophilin family peptidyl-prolyl cis-trans isomerase
MQRLLIPILLGSLALPGTAQEIPGVRATLSAARPLFAAGNPIELRLLVEVTADAKVPTVLLNGAKLTVNVGGKGGPRIEEPGQGEAVALAAGTRIERRFSFPAERLAPNVEVRGVTNIVVAWDGLAGANCSFRLAPDMSKVDLSKLDLARTEVVLVTNYGEMTVAFRPEKAPRHVENFLKLCKSGFYDGTKFHRVIRDFMIQGGDPNTRNDAAPETWGNGGPGYSIDAEFNDLRHLRGTLSMARTTDPNSAGSQFFLVHKDSPHLDGQYSAFGNIVKGADVLDRIANVPVGGPQNSLPIEPVILESAVLLPVEKK